MLENKGKNLIKTIITTIITAIILVVVLTIIAKLSVKVVTNTQLKDLKTDMLLIQQQAKKYSEEVSKQTVNLDEKRQEDSEKITEVESTQLLGIKVSECSEEIQLKAKQAGITNLEEYYCLNKEDLEKMGISNIKIKEGEYFLVKYNLEDTEIIYTEGFEYQDKLYYKLTELEEINETEN